MIWSDEQQPKALSGVRKDQAEQLATWMRDPANRKMLYQLQKLGVAAVNGGAQRQVQAAAALEAKLAGAGPATPAAAVPSKADVEPADAATAALSKAIAAVPLTVAEQAAATAIAASSSQAADNVNSQDKIADAESSGNRLELQLPLTGMRVALTGELTVQGFDRTLAGKAISAMGGTLVDSVTKHTSFLLAGDAPSAAVLRKAEQLDILVLYEQEFITDYGDMRDWYDSSDDEEG